MSLIAMLAVGLIAGLLASWIMKAKTGWIVDLILGLIGSLLGGWIYSLITKQDFVGAFDFKTILVAIGGSILVILIFRLFKRGR
jgi:uncharacterized membrane protein YeaQ/YmgE (transglycosylase-associated protein family)